MSIYLVISDFHTKFFHFQILSKLFVFVYFLRMWAFLEFFDLLNLLNFVRLLSAFVFSIKNIKERELEGFLIQSNENMKEVIELS